MNARPLRSTAVQKPKTQGERIRYARIGSNLSQAQLARAVSQISGGKVTKSLVSQWESGDVKNPNNANMLAIQAVTSFAVNWLVTGRGPMRISLPSANPNNIAPLDIQRLCRAIEAAEPNHANAAKAAKVIAGLYDLLGDTPDIAPNLLHRFAAALAQD